MDSKDSHKSWVEISVEGDTESTEAICEVFQKHGTNGISIEEIDMTEELRTGPQSLTTSKPVLIKTYIPNDGHTNTLKEKIYSDIHYFSMIRPIKLLGEQIIQEDDWAENWKKFFRPHKIGDNIVIVPTWEEYRSNNSEIVIKLDPGMAFGTGLHPSTQLCLSQAERWIKNNDTVLDFGIGSGILSIAVAGFGATNIIGVDIDPMAVKTAKLNVELNDCSDRVTVIQDASPLAAIDMLKDKVEKKRFDLILANITADILIENCNELLEALDLNGILIGSGILQEQITEVTYSFMEQGFRLIDIVSEGEWRTIVMKKVQL